MEYELLDRGYGLGDVGTLNLSWAEFRVLVRGWMRQPHNALAEALAGHSVWSVGEQLMAAVFDATVYGNWLLARVNGNKSAPRPKPLPRPWDAKPQKFGSGALPYDEIDAWVASTQYEGE